MRLASAREIALAIGVPPMLLGIPGDNTYSNYAEAQRAFWRQTVLPLVNRMANGFSNWLGPAFALGGSLSIAPSDSASRSRPEGAGLLLKPDLDQVEALNPEREALWSRLEGVSFLTDNEKRAAAGYAATGDSGAKYRADQPRVPAGNSDGGRWTGEGGDTRPYSQNDSAFRVAQVGSGRSGYPYDILEEDQLGGIHMNDMSAGLRSI